MLIRLYTWHDVVEYFLLSFKQVLKSIVFIEVCFADYCIHFSRNRGLVDDLHCFLGDYNCGNDVECERNKN